MSSISPSKVILFNLGIAFFDPDYPLQWMFSILRDKFPALATKGFLEVSRAYKIVQEEKDEKNPDSTTDKMADPSMISRILDLLELPAPTPDEANDLYATYQELYQESHVVTKNALSDLRQDGYKIVVIARGETDARLARMQEIGLLPLVDRIITEQETEKCNPKCSILQYAVYELGLSPWGSFMVGDSLETDVQGALSVELKPVLHAPEHCDSHYFLGNLPIPTIQDLSQLLAFLRVSPRLL